MKKNIQVNLSIQICKLIASMFVVFIHFKFPGTLGEVIDCIARFAVPIFFAISGYFSYNAEENKLKKRIIHMLKLNIFAISFYLILGIIETYFIYDGNVLNYLYSMFNLKTLAKWFIMNEQPAQVHLWYLSSILIVYIFLWIYVRFFKNKVVDYKPLYMTGLFLIFIHIFVSSNAAASGILLPYTIYRNAIFWGMPMFCLGIFINEYYERIIHNFNLSNIKLIIFVILGLLVSLLEYIGIGKIEMPIGMIVVVISLLLLVIKCPNYNLIKNKFILLILNKLSLIIYIIHPSISCLLTSFLKTNLYERLYLYPLIVLSLSILFGTVYILLTFLLKKINYIKK